MYIQYIYNVLNIAMESSGSHGALTSVVFHSEPVSFCRTRRVG
jgi:hypothetical protein